MCQWSDLQIVRALLNDHNLFWIAPTSVFYYIVDSNKFLTNYNPQVQSHALRGVGLLHIGNFI
eukprot:snap_masked-scaffold_27-processed-gene-2.16-mRNA-1 protein AED:1.00 eAED:1.00 QI:0/0/0/0/1/1/2/0/62